MDIGGSLVGGERNIVTIAPLSVRIDPNTVIICQAKLSCT